MSFISSEKIHYGVMFTKLCIDFRETSSLFMSTARQLSEACQLAYMSGQWVHTDRYGNTLIKIVESTLPGNGVYSAGVTSGELGVWRCFVLMLLSLLLFG